MAAAAVEAEAEVIAGSRQNRPKAPVAPKPQSPRSRDMIWLVLGLMSLCYQTTCIERGGPGSTLLISRVVVKVAVWIASSRTSQEALKLDEADIEGDFDTLIFPVSSEENRFCPVLP